MTGWVKVHRSLLDNPIWKEKPFSKGQAWVDILMLANHKEKDILIGNRIETIEVGSFITSELHLMERWGWSKNKVRAFLKLLQSESMIVKDSNRKRTAINVVNYSKYQILETTKEPQKNHKRTTKEPQKVHNQEVNNEKNVENEKNKTYTCAFEEFWLAYPRKKDKGNAFKKYNARLESGFSEVQLLEAAKKYADECQRNETEQKYIKHATTFLSSCTPFVDYLDENGLSVERDSCSSEVEQDRFACINPVKRAEFEVLGIIDGQSLNLGSATDEQIEYLKKCGVL